MRFNKATNVGSESPPALLQLHIIQPSPVEPTNQPPICPSIHPIAAHIVMRMWGRIQIKGSGTISRTIQCWCWRHHSKTVGSFFVTMMDRLIRIGGAGGGFKYHNYTCIKCEFWEIWCESPINISSTTHSLVYTGKEQYSEELCWRAKEREETVLYPPPLLSAESTNHTTIINEQPMDWRRSINCHLLCCTVHTIIVVSRGLIGTDRGLSASSANVTNKLIHLHERDKTQRTMFVISSLSPSSASSWIT